MHFDPTLYPDPHRYNPDRYLDQPCNNLTAGECIHTSDMKLRDHWSFGAGRRVCAGYNLAENSLLILTARLLWAFDVKPAIDPSTGKEMQYDVWKYGRTRLFGPLPFPVRFEVRSELKRDLIMKGVTS
jgi:cytochrome P450